MTSRLYNCVVSHQRLGPVDQSFSYAMHFLAFDLDKLETLDREVKGFGYNHARPLSIHDRDYVVPEEGSIREKILSKLAENAVKTRPDRIVLLTAPRYFGYVFNPASFYLGYRENGALCVLVAEVNNTFGDRHLYVMPVTTREARDTTATVSHEKEFHVSPFYGMRGEYRFRVVQDSDDLDIRIEMRRDGVPVFRAALTGRGAPLTTRSLYGMILRHPLRPWMTMPRILIQAGFLHFRAGLPVYRRPEPTSPRTVVRRRPGLAARLAMKTVLPILSSMKIGMLRLVLPDGSEFTCGDDMLGPTETLHVRDYRFFRQLALGGDVGFGEAFMDGDVTCDDVTRVLKLLIANRAYMADRSLLPARLGRLRNRLGHVLRPNSHRMSRRNIRAHYDLRNDLFRTFLDPTMTYSSAVFRSPHDTLEEAQRNKLRILIDKARIERAHHILEIGSGWGSLAIEAARRTGCRVTSVTLSKEQRDLATRRVREAGLDHLVEIRLCDYRNVRGSFDRIVSVEMLEAVGHRYYGTFFEQCEKLLKPDGLVVLQVITIPDERYEAYRRGCDWIQKHIFPGGHLPSLSALTTAMARTSRLYVEHMENIGPHYATTLRRWLEAFEQNEDEVAALGFDETFRRKWKYYLAYCEAAFATRTLNTLQLILSRANNRQLLRDDERGAAPVSNSVRSALSLNDSSVSCTHWL